MYVQEQDIQEIAPEIHLHEDTVHIPDTVPIPTAQAETPSRSVVAPSPAKATRSSRSGREIIKPARYQDYDMS